MQPSIAVLPLVAMSEGRDREYFADRLAGELLERLAQTPGVPRSRAQRRDAPGERRPAAQFPATLQSRRCLRTPNVEDERPRYTAAFEAS